MKNNNNNPNITNPNNNNNNENEEANNLTKETLLNNRENVLQKINEMKNKMQKK